MDGSAKKAIGFLKMSAWKKIATTQQLQELQWAIEMIKIGRFQQLARKINQVPPKKGRKAAKKMLEEAIEIIKILPKETQHDSPHSHKERRAKRLPTIILSESFDW